MEQSWRAITVFGIIVLAVLAGCRDALPPPSGESAAAARRSSGEFVEWEESLGLESSATAAFERTDLPYFARLTLVELAVFGRIHVYSAPGTSPTSYTGPISANGIWQSSQNACYVQVLFSYVDSAGWYTNWTDGPCATQQNGPFKESVRTVRAVKGWGRVRRGNMFTHTNSCGYGVQCRTFSGEQTASVRVLPAGLQLRASKRFVGVNENVAFTADADPVKIEGVTVPVHVTGWQWSASGGGAGATGQCAPGNPCTRSIKESGTMQVTAIVQGVQRTASVDVQVVPCPTGDTIADNPVWRSGLAAAWAESNAEAAPADRKERGVYLFDSAGTYQARLSPPDSTDTACQNANLQPTPSGWRRVAGGHTHPFRIGDSTANSCKGPDDPPDALGTRRIYVGISPADMLRAHTESIPQYVVDKTSIYRVLPHPVRAVETPKGYAYEFSSGWRSKIQRWPRVHGSCVRI
jgi:hypothetical protein